MTSATLTPVLDGLARDGIRLTAFYAGATVCTPSRMALLTGAYPSRLGWTKGVVGYLIDKKKGLSPKALTMAKIFKEKGYQTGIVGKWHLGDRSPFLPHRQGFDQTYYINKSNNQTKELWRGDELLEKPFNNRLLTEQFTREAIRFINDNKAKPFLLYVPSHRPGVGWNFLFLGLVGSSLATSRAPTQSFWTIDRAAR